jgi:hypothetical protein
LKGWKNEVLEIGNDVDCNLFGDGGNFGWVQKERAAGRAA